jgi:hypothetical protein
VAIWDQHCSPVPTSTACTVSRQPQACIESLFAIQASLSRNLLLNLLHNTLSLTLHIGRHRLRLLPDLFRFSLNVSRQARRSQLFLLAPHIPVLIPSPALRELRREVYHVAPEEEVVLRGDSQCVPHKCRTVDRERRGEFARDAA